MSGFTLSPDTRCWRLPGGLTLESGAHLAEVDLAYRTWGRLNAARDNAVIVCHALTGTADVDAWWAPLLGAGRALDPTRDFIVAANVLGGCYGSTGPTTRAPDGQPWGARFPRVSIRDQVRAQIALAEQLGVRRVRWVIGGSMGGLQALEWALLARDRVDGVISIAASGRHSPWCIAWSEAQRRALAADPAYRDGDYAPEAPPRAGLAAARAIAMVSYRSAQALARRFGRDSGATHYGERARAPDEFAVANWLRHHGEELVARFDANTYVTLTRAMDSHDLARGRGDYAEVLARVTQPVLVVSIDSDALYVPDEQRELAEHLPNAELAELNSEHGHDAFLIEAERLNEIVRDYRARQERPLKHAVGAGHD